MSKLPIPLNQFYSKSNPSYVFENTVDNRLVMDCLLRSNNRTVSETQISDARKEYEARKHDPVIINQWVTAILSGEYFQERRFLKAKNNYRYFSVLGILCEITKDLTGGKWNGCWFLPKDEEFDKGVNQQSYDAPEFVYKKLGLKDFKTYYPLGHGKKSNHLALLNEQYNLNELADIIQKEYLK